MQKITIVSLVVLVIVGAGIGLLFKYSPPSQGNLIEESIIKLFEADSLSFQGSAKLSTSNPSPLNGEINFNGNLEKFSDEWKVQTAFGLNAQIGEDLAQGFNFGAEVISLDRMLFLQITDWPAELLAGLLDEEILNMFLGQWLSLDLDKAKEIIGFQEGDELVSERSRQFLIEIKDVFQENPILVIDKDLGAGHYEVSVDKEGLKKLVPQYVDLVKKYLPEEQRVAYQEEVDNNLVELPETIDQIWEETGGLTFEVWISEEDGYLERFKYQSELTEQVEGSFELEVSFSGLNQQQNIKAPDSALPLDEFFSSIIPQDIIAPEAN